MSTIEFSFGDLIDEATERAGLDPAALTHRHLNSINRSLNLLHTDIENNGAEHRKEIGTSLYKWLKKNGFPPGFQVLCANCNWGKRQCGGTCPHRLPKQPLD